MSQQQAREQRWDEIGVDPVLRVARYRSESNEATCDLVRRL